MNHENASTIFTILWVTLAVAARIVTDKVTKISEIFGKLIVAAFVAIIVQNLIVLYHLPEGIRAPIIGICSYLASDLAVWIKVTWHDYSKSIGKLLYRYFLRVFNLDEEKDLKTSTDADDKPSDETHTDTKK